MRDPQQPRRRWPGPVTGLLLALALAACPGGDDTPEPGAAGGDSAQLRLASAPGADTTCTPPPSPPANLLTPSTPWADLEKWLDSTGVTFPDTPDNVATDTVPLCLGCASVGVRLQSTNRTFCLKADSAGVRRIAGRLTLLEPYPGGNGYNPIPAGHVLYLFSRGTPGLARPATVVYRHNDRVTPAPPNAWRFYYCLHDTVIKHPAARWRSEDSITQQQQQQQTTTADAAEEGGGSYAWMSCANGCCQFYTPPPSHEFPDLPEVGKTPNQQPGNAQRDSFPVPKWCPGGSNHP